ncbi:MAG TPA: hypothetical protein VNI34_06705 [Candidatus Nitrosotalea sp.]|nr:hypothetical protein [Candidatus Nitrosotalea sp.]
MRIEAPRALRAAAGSLAPTHLLGALALGSVLVAGPGIALIRPERVLLAAILLSVLLIGLLSGSRRWALALLLPGLAAVVLVALAVAGPGVSWTLLVLLVLVGGQIALEPALALRSNLRGPAIAVLLLSVGELLLRAPNNPGLGRVGALSLALFIPALAGLAPFHRQPDAAAPLLASSLLWTALVAPVVALSLPLLLTSRLNADEASVFSSVLLAVGLMNLVVGTIGAWRASEIDQAWHFSCAADWGLVLVGLALWSPDGRAASFLALLGITAVRLPLWAWSRRPGREEHEPSGGLSLIVGAALAGAAPFAGFSARLILLRASAAVSWPLTVVLILPLLLWPLHSLRLGRSLGRPGGGMRLGVGVVLAVSLALGLLPGLFLGLAGD